jgi:hypothetical protein
LFVYAGLIDRGGYRPTAQCRTRKRSQGFNRLPTDSRSQTNSSIPTDNLLNRTVLDRGQYPQLEPISNQPNSDCLWHSGGTEPEHGVQTVCDLIE